MVIGLLILLTARTVADDSQQPVAASSWTVVGHLSVRLDGYADDARPARPAGGRKMFLARSCSPAGEQLLSREELPGLLKRQAARRTRAHRFFQTSGTAGFASGSASVLPHKFFSPQE